MNNLDFKISPLKYEDGKKLKEWTSYDNPLLVGYNYNNLTDKELLLWYVMKQKKFRSSYFSIYVGDDLIGYFGIKDINNKLKTAELGIVFDAKWTSKGYGTKVLEQFLEYYFTKLNMRRLDLEVNSWNERALRLYKKFGFKIDSEKFVEFENQKIDITSDKYKDMKEHFLIEDDIVYTKIYTMKLKKQEYIDENRD